MMATSLLALPTRDETLDLFVDINLEVLLPIELDTDRNVALHGVSILSPKGSIEVQGSNKTTQVSSSAGVVVKNRQREREKSLSTQELSLGWVSR
ncbi:hypothetical protein QJS04_geneDACA014658 [Acorus gramineus]|uniref:Uncharacterized protein n=1 Tax=Acorus gramineus TaxID=55184 RepID=A0AAV9B7A5_ACOGR|nr:hypothetical protein QJS04_geneDACA014658 [Acorus gramineus]